MSAFLRWALFTQHNALEILHVVVIIHSCSLLSSSPWTECIKFTYPFTLEG